MMVVVLVFGVRLVALYYLGFLAGQAEVALAGSI
jgi:hypothetical protein